jgi:chemotaxis protein methyltransferase CheR
MTLAEQVGRQARTLVATRLGLDFPENRQRDLEQGFLRAFCASSVAQPELYLSWLTTLPDGSPEWWRLAGHLTVGETYFFRDHSCFEALEQKVLPSIITSRRAEGILRLRLWSAGCATGEEAYSLAILVDRLLPDRSDWVVTILATDINPDALEKAQRAVYREWALRETPEWLRNLYFRHRGAEAFEVAPKIREMVTFAPLNLAGDGYPSLVTNTGAMDLILCRNVLMYFTRDAQQATVARLQRALVTGGWLVVSPVEASAELLSPLVPVNFPGATAYRKEPHPSVSSQPTWESALQATPQAESKLFNLPAYEAPAAEPEPAVPHALHEQRAEASLHSPTDLQRAKVLADQGRLDDAVRLCESVLARNRLDHEAYFLWAVIAQERGEVIAALEALRRVVYLVPNFVSAHFLLGSILLRQGQHKQGLRSMETVVRLLSSLPCDEEVPGSDGLTAGRLLETARAYLEIRR